MIIECRSCHSKFRVNPQDLEPNGRFVHCSICSNEWLAQSEDLFEELGNTYSNSDINAILLQSIDKTGDISRSSQQLPHKEGIKLRKTSAYNETAIDEESNLSLEDSVASAELYALTQALKNRRNERNTEALSTSLEEKMGNNANNSEYSSKRKHDNIEHSYIIEDEHLEDDISFEVINHNLKPSKESTSKKIATYLKNLFNKLLGSNKTQAPTQKLAIANQNSAQRRNIPQQLNTPQHQRTTQLKSQQNSINNGYNRNFKTNNLNSQSKKPAKSLFITILHKSFPIFIGLNIILLVAISHPQIKNSLRRKIYGFYREYTKNSAQQTDIHKVNTHRAHPSLHHNEQRQVQANHLQPQPALGQQQQYQTNSYNNKPKQEQSPELYGNQINHNAESSKGIIIQHRDLGIEVIEIRGINEENTNLHNFISTNTNNTLNNTKNSHSPSYHNHKTTEASPDIDGKNAAGASINAHNPQIISVKIRNRLKYATNIEQIAIVSYNTHGDLAFSHRIAVNKQIKAFGCSNFLFKLPAHRERVHSLDLYINNIIYANKFKIN